MASSGSVPFVYPSHDDPLFAEKLAMMEDFGIFRIDPQLPITSKEDFEKRASALCQFEKTYYQHLVAQYISSRSPYRSLLLYHGLGTGKSCSAITIAETFLTGQRLYDEPNVWVVSKKALKKSFELEVFRTILLASPEFLREQCTGDTYYQMIPDYSRLSQDKLVQRIHKVIKSRYQFFGYEKFANTIEKYMEEGTLEEKIRDKVIIIDEAHNVRYLEGSEENKEGQKKIVEPLLKLLQLGQNNRLVLLSATPMYNEPEEVLWLMSLLALNDKKDHLLQPFRLPSFFTKTRKQNERTFALMAELSSYYISYVRGNNPFTFALRVSPRLLGIKMLEDVPKKTFQGIKIPIESRGWLSYIQDGIVPSPISGIQLDGMKDMLKNKMKLSTAILRQRNNITYKKQLTKDTFEYVEGKEGFFSIFRKIDESATPIQLEYIHPENPILKPSYGELLHHSAKFYTLSKLLQKAEGIVVIYSNFIWGGLVPLAIMLEHMGFSRYGEADLLRSQDKVGSGDRIRYKHIERPRYCILSGENEKDIMGSSKIDDLLPMINDPVHNEHGKAIKVILMSPVASEGLTFKNVREMHILDPWYHMNTTEQAIGRAIRHCSHSSLPLEQRNVSVFLHATTFPENDRETEDLHAYRLSAMKQFEIQAVDKVIHENAMDCSLLTHVNYFPKDIFQFVSTLQTSHGKEIPYRYGDDENKKIKCKHSVSLSSASSASSASSPRVPPRDTPRVPPRDTRAFREESYASLLPTIQSRLRKVLQENYEKKGVVSYTYEELLSLAHKNREVSHRAIEMSLYPYKLWGSYGMFYQYQRFYITKFDEKDLKPTRLLIEEAEEIVPQENRCQNIESILEEFALDPIDTATIRTFQALDSVCWKHLAEKVISTPQDVSRKLAPILSILTKEGLFVRSQELPNLPTNSGFVGYANPFAKEDQFEVFVWEQENQRFREAVPSELEKIKRQRKEVPFPNPSKIRITDTIAFASRYKNAKDPNSPYRLQFKLGLDNTKGKRLGVVCDSGLKKTEIEKELEPFVPKDAIKGNISLLCFQLMLELRKAGRLWFPVSWKPKA